MADANDSPLIQKALDSIDALLVEVARKRAWVNEADKMEGRAPRFTDVDAFDGGSGGGTRQSPSAKKWKPGDFFNKSFAGAAKLILAARFDAAREANPASVDEIHEALLSGSFSFDGNGADAQKHSI